MMKSKTIRNWIFLLHRYLGLAIGLIIALIGLTGSLLVFMPELATEQVKNSLPKIVPQAERVPLEVLYQQVETYLQARDPNFKEITELVVSEYRFFDLDEPTYLIYTDNREDFHQIFVDPYTGKIIGNETNLGFDYWSYLLDLHTSLLAGEMGTYLVGSVGLSTTLLCLTGIFLWPGWRKLINGFKIKWDGHIKRRNFDLHKVVGIIVSLFLAMITFTGFCWNFDTWVMPAIYALTLSEPHPTDRGVELPLLSIPPLGQDDTGSFSKHLPEILEVTNANFPGGMFSNGYIDEGPLGVINIVQCYLQRNMYCGVLEFDKYSGKLIRKWELDKGVSLGDRIINSFPAIHYGHFAGFTSRILYIFVGLSPTFLLATGFVMWSYRKPSRSK